MFSSIKMYIAAAFSAIVMVLIAVFKHRGNKIEELEKDVEVKDRKIAVTAKVVEAEKKAAGFVADNRVAAAIAEGEDAKDLNDFDPTIKHYI